MADPASPSVGDPPPRLSAESHPADELRRHPLWEKASGRGSGSGRGSAPGRGGRGRGRGAAPVDEGGDVRFERISLLTQELQNAATGGDGADSEAESDDETTRGNHADDEGASEYADPESDDGSDDERRPPQKKQRAGPSDTDAMFASAAFGAPMPRGPRSEADSEVSRTESQRKRDAKRAVFPVKGITCVGCALASRIAPVERYVLDNIGRQSERAVWKFSALVYKKEIVEPALREGVEAVPWGWRDIANHFKLHTTCPAIGRTGMINTLTAMRLQAESTIVRNDGGERSIDKSNAELLLKILASESKERQLLHSERGPAGGKGKGQKPAGGED